jgi:hypothetical protein
VRFLRFDVPTTQDVHVIVASQTANRDANVRIYRRGVLIASGIVGSSDEDVFVTLSPGTYVIYAYDYRNVSGTANATPLNVTVRN